MRKTNNIDTQAKLSSPLDATSTSRWETDAGDKNESNHQRRYNCTASSSLWYVDSSVTLGISSLLGGFCALAS